MDIAFEALRPQRAALGADRARHHHRRRRGDRDDGHRRRRAAVDQGADQSLGTNLVTVSARLGHCRRRAARTGRRDDARSPADAQAILAEVPGVEAVSPGVTTRTQVAVAGRQLVHAGPGRGRRPGRDSRLAARHRRVLRRRRRHSRRQGRGAGRRRARSALRRRRRSGRRRPSASTTSRSPSSACWRARASGRWARTRTTP